MKLRVATVAAIAALAAYIFLVLAFTLSSWSEHARFTQRVNASASNNNLSLLVQQTDTSGSPILNRSIGPVQYAGSVGVFTNGIYNDTSAHTQTLPVSPVLQFYFKNTHATAVYTVTWTTQGGASVVAQKVQPGGVFAFWSPVTSATAGITGMTLTSDTSGGTYEMFLGG